MAYKLDFYQDNTLINLNVLRVAHETGVSLFSFCEATIILKWEQMNKVKKFLSGLSTCIFPAKTTYPIYETLVHNWPPPSSNLGYTYSKRMIYVMNQYK